MSVRAPFAAFHPATAGSSAVPREVPGEGTPHSARSGRGQISSGRTFVRLASRVPSVKADAPGGAARTR